MAPWREYEGNLLNADEVSISSTLNTKDDKIVVPFMLYCRDIFSFPILKTSLNLLPQIRAFFNANHSDL